MLDLKTMKNLETQTSMMRQVAQRYKSPQVFIGHYRSHTELQISEKIDATIPIE